MAKTTISWTQRTWNPSTGCNKLSDGCKYCYAEKMSHRLKGMGQVKYQNDFKLTVHPNSLTEPYGWKSPQLVFVNSMSDLFHEKMPIDFIKSVFKVMNENPKHTFQVLTKRANILERLSPQLAWTENIWMGVTVESNRYLNRINSLLKTNAHIKFLSLEPLISSLNDLKLDGIDWVIVAGETGSNSRPLQKEWVIEIKDKCKEMQVPFFFKQWGGYKNKRAGCLIDGQEYKEMPVFGRIQ